MRVDFKTCVQGSFCTNESLYGTAVAVARTNSGVAFLTAAHNFESRNQGNIAAINVGGRSGRLVGKWIDDKCLDIAIVFVSGSRQEPVPVSQDAPQAGDLVTVAGFDFAVTSSPQVRYYSGRVAKSEKGALGETDFSWPVGTSGGSVVNRNGELVGIAVHSSGFMVNWNFRDSVSSFFPDAQFAAASSRSKYSRKESVEAEDSAPPPPVIDAEPPSGPLALDKDEVSGASKESELSKLLNEQSARLSQLAESVAALRPASGVEKSSETTSGQKQETPPSGTSPDVVSADANGRGRVSDIKERTGEVLDVADSVASNPWVQAAIVGATGGTGAAGLAAFQLLMRWRKKRRSQQQSESQSESRQSQSPVVIKAGSDDRSSSAPPPDTRIDSIIRYLKDKEADSRNIEKIVESIEGLTARVEVQPDGSTAETFWKDGVRLAKNGGLSVNVLGGPAVAREIENYVARRHAMAAGDNLPGV